MPPSRFGRGFSLQNGDLTFAAGDLATVEGRDNLLQGLAVMIETPFGSDVFNVSYGFSFLEAVSQVDSIRLVKEFLRLNLVKSLSGDNRIREVKDVVFDDDPRFFDLSPQANAEERRARRKTAREWEALVVLETVPEGQVVLNVAGVGV
jgi:3-deoxy-D-manno-octulosonic-acid transferase